MSDNRKELKKILKIINFEDKNKIEDVLSKKDKQLEQFFKSLTNEILFELNNLNNNIKNDKNNFTKYDKNFLYQMIKLFIYIRKDNIKQELIESLITKDYIKIIIYSVFLINKNEGENPDENIIDFNNNIVDLLNSIMNMNPELLLQNLVLNKDNFLYDSLLAFSKNKKGRNFIYDCEGTIFSLFPNNDNYKILVEFMKYTIDYISLQLNKNNFISIFDEIQVIIHIYKNNINIISNSMNKLLINIFIINENNQKDENENSYKNDSKIINNILRFCFDRLVFFYSGNMNMNFNEKKEKTSKNEFKYNKDFMDFLLEVYDELTKKNLKNSYTDFLMELFLGIDNIKYVWLVNETKYPQIVLKSLIELRDFNLLSLYFSKILYLSFPNLTDNYYIPEYDINFFFTKLDIILSDENEEDNEKMFNIISSQIMNLVNVYMNKENMRNIIIDILINKCSIFNIFSLIINSDSYSKSIKTQLVDFLEKILQINNNDIKYNMNITITNELDLDSDININDINTYGIKYKFFSLALEYDFNMCEYMNKVNIILNKMNYCYENKNTIELILFGDILLKSILTDNKISYINEFDLKTLTKINKTFINASTILFNDSNYSKEKNMDIINKFIYQIIIFIYEFNQKFFILKKNKECKFNQVIFQENTIKIIVKYIFELVNDFSIKEKIVNEICKMHLNENDNTYDIKKNDNNNNGYIVQRPFFIMILFETLYEIKDYQSILYLYNNLFEIINFSVINIKLLIKFNIISITTKILIDLYVNKMESKENETLYEECYNKTFLLLNYLIKFITQSLLVQYLFDIFYIFNDSIINNTNNTNLRYKKIISILFSFLKENLNSSSNKIQKQNYEYISLSKKIFNNPFIYNIFYINNIKTEEAIIHYNVDIRISSYNTIGDFYIANFFNENINMSLFIIINNKNQLIVGEKAIDKNEIQQLDLVENINDYLLADNNFHNISIIIDTENKNIKILINYKKINQQSNYINYKNFLFSEFSIIVGYDYDVVNSFNNKDNKDNEYNFSIIDISNILVINYKNDVDNYILNTEKETNKKIYISHNLLEYLFFHKKEYYYKFILAEICFNTNNIKLVNSKEYINNYSDSKIFNKYLKKDNENISKYIAFIEIINPFTKQENAKLYMASINNNIENYFSANNIFTIQNINKNVLNNIFSENFNIFYSSDNYLFIDFLIGFLFDIDKRTEFINNNNKSNIDNIILLEDNFINEYLLLIFEIILNLPNKKLISYFLYENENISIKLKYFFKRNIYLLNDKSSLIKLIDLLNNQIEYSLIFNIEILLDLLIFSLINNENQNIILINIKRILEIAINTNEKNKLELTENICSLLYKLFEKFYYLILYYQLSTTEIEESNNEKQIDIILYCTSVIFTNIEKIYSKKYESKITKLTVNIINICSKLQESVQTHNIKLFLDKYQNILSEKFIFIDNYQINHQIELITKLVSKYLAKLVNKKKEEEDDEAKKNLFDFFSKDKNENGNNNKNNNIQKDDHSFEEEDNSNIIINTGNDEKNNSSFDLGEEIVEQSKFLIFSKKCCFCSYLYSYFKIRFDSVYEEIKYEKYKNNFYRNLFINFDEYKTKLGINKYVWYLSQKESSHQIQNKFFIKENKIKIVGNKNQINDNLYRYEYINDIEQYNKIVVELHKIFLYDNISIDHHFIYSFSNILNYEGNIILAENCLLINKLLKTISLFLIYNDFLLIMTNICIDNENKLHIAVNEFNMNIWCIKNEEYMSELDNYIKNNEKCIIKNYFEKKENNIKKPSNEFGYNKYYKFNIKKIKFSEINEMHKVSYLQIPNSIEIITKNGANYFLCFNVKKRDFIFSTITDYIPNLSSENIQNNKNKSNVSKKVNKTNSDNCFYMKHCPKNYLEKRRDNIFFSYLGTVSKFQLKKSIIINQKLRLNKKEIYNKAIIEKNIFLTEISKLWRKNKISNFDYLMLLNILSGRSLINLSQYFIFPLILVDFNNDKLNWLNKAIYRDLSVPIFACDSILKNNLSNLEIKKFDLNEIGNKYHSGTFYSTHAFVSYFLIRQHPYTDIHLEIQGGVFDSADRLFIGTKELSSLEDKHQELIPSIYTLPELYINTNNFNFGKIQNIFDKKRENQINIVNDFILPKWAEGDPRKFILILKKILESKKINEKLNNWIDLIFGYKMKGSESIKCYNTFRKACYELSNEEIEEMNKNGELLGILLEKQELGYLAKQLFKSPHNKKGPILNEFKEYENIFFDTNIKLRNIKFIKINKDIEYNSNKLMKINDFMIETSNEYINNTMNIKNYNYQGGISSLKTIMNALTNETNPNNKNIISLKLINSLEKECKFKILEKRNIFLGESTNNIILQYNKRIIKILYNNYNAYSYYCLNEIGNISVIVCNQKGNKLYIGFDNGNIIRYKIKLIKKYNTTIEPNCIYPFKNYIPFNNANNSKRKTTGSFKKKNGDSNNINNIIIFEKIQNNNFTINNPHIPHKIKKLSLDEENNILIALSSFNIIYIISLNNNFKLMHIIPYYSKKYYNYNYKIKGILPISNNSEFIIYSSISVHLFSINGIPICELNLLDKVYNHISKITYCVVVFIYDVILFTGHKNGSIYIWKVKNKNRLENFKERASYIYNNKNSKSFLPEYDYGYSFNFNKNIKDFELQRKFDIVNKIDKGLNYPIKYMKMNNDMSYMIVIYENKNISIVTDIEEDNTNINNDNGYLLSINKKKKIYCYVCGKETDDSCCRVEYITSNSNHKNEESDNGFEIIDNINIINEIEDNDKKEDEKKKEENKKPEDFTYLCDECKQILDHTENYLYNY